MVKSFKDWTQTELKETFGLVNKNGDCDELKSWLDTGEILMKKSLLTDFEQYSFDFIRNRLSINADIWNEEELKMYFIARLLDIVDFESEQYKLFFERKLSTVKNGIKLNGNVDAMIATGNFDVPRAPYFCLHEYKPEKSGRDTDPRGQLLSEMLAAQTINGNQNIIYGCYMLGRLWFFATLIGSDFCFSGGYVADDKEDLLRIVFILRQLKLYLDKATLVKK